MNNFPKVMENLGIASENSEKAVNKLSDGLNGLPTTLDAGALAVQRFTSKNGDVQKSVDMFLAVNNALLAGGASAEIQSTALEQLTQGYAKGKLDMDEWRSIQTAMPAQLKQVAQAMGMTTEELGEGLREGEIAMDDFIDTIMKLNKEGTGQFLSFAEQAKNATGGIKTSITNAKTAITRGVASIVTAFDEMLKNNGLGGLSAVINKIGKTSENVLKNVANSIPKVVSKIKDVYNWIKKNQDIIKKLVIIVASLTAGYVAYKKVLVAIKAIQTAKNILATVSAFLSLIPTIRSAKDAMLLLNMAFNANPIGILIAGITALVVGITASIIAINKQKNSLGGLKEEVEKQRESWEQLKKSREESLKSSSLEIATTQKLADELRKITDENGKVKEGYENRANYILGELNKALGTEYEMNGNIISQYQELKDNIDNLIASKKAEATLEAYKSEYQTALKEKTEATKTLTDLTKKYNEQLQISEDKTKTIAERNEAQGQVEKIGKEIENQTKLISEYGYTIEQYEKLTTASVSASAEEIEKAVSNMGVSYDQAKEKANASLTSQVQIQSNYVDLIEQNLQKAKDTNDKFSQNILETELNTQKEQLQNLINSFGERTSTIESLSSEEVTTWATLARNNKDEYLKALDELPEETRKKVEKAIEGVKNTESLLNGTFSNLGEENKIQFGNQLKLKETVQDKMAQAGVTIQNDTTVSDATRILASNADKGFNNNVDGRTWGTDLASNISGGMTSPKSKSGIIGAAASIASWIKANIGHSVPETGPLKDELTYMPDMIDNLVKGIEKNRYKVMDATNHIAKDIKDGFDLEGLNEDIMREMNKAVSIETNSINAKASVKSNNSMLNVIQASFNIDGSVNIDGQKAGRMLAPAVSKTLRTAGA